MKAILISIAAIVLFTGGCKKKDVEGTPTPNQQITMKTFAKETFELNVDTKQGYVTLNIEELPEFVTIDDLTPVTGNTPLSTGLSIRSQNAVAGKHTFKLVSFKDGLTDSAVVTAIDLNIEPFTSDECNTFFNKLANGNNASTFVQDMNETRGFKEQPGIVFNNGQLSFNNLVVYYLITQNFTISKASAADQQIPFTIDCEGAKLTIPETTVTDADGKSYTLSGNGVIDYTTQSYILTYTSNGQTMLLKGSIDFDAYFTP